MKVLFDTNVILDALQGREPWRENAEKLIMAVAGEKIEGYVTTKELCDIWYLAKQIHRNEENANKKAQLYISKLCKLFYILDTTSVDIENALSLEQNDFEDMVMYETAVRSGMDVLVSRNIKDFSSLDTNLKLYSPEELVNILKADN